ncbi:MAG: hypothetical protein JXA69_03875 [Phycisphaerae bacterium]|nr:hypothetical protein [Phycisphaerae bacterium]
MSNKKRILVVAVLCLFSGTVLVYGQTYAQTGDCDPPNVKVCGKIRIPNKTGEDANDLHFYMYQADRPSTVVTGAQVSSDGCAQSAVTLGTDDGSGSPPPGYHGAQVDLEGCDIPAGGQAVVEVCLCMNERNILKIKDVEFTSDGDPLPDPDPPPAGGWRIARPFLGGDGGDRSPGGGGRGAQEGNGGTGYWIHRVYIENDDVRWMVVDELKLLASMTQYPYGATVNWAAVAPIVDHNGQPPVCIPPGGRYCYEFHTTGSYVGGHVYLKYSIRPALPGECVGGPAPEGILAEGDDDDGIEMIGDHPVDEEMTEVLIGDDFWVTTSPTEVEFGGSIPSVPSDFFGPGSDPFTGSVALTGQPLDPAHSQADTIVRRLGEAYLPTVGSADTIPVELAALNLVSVEPIRVKVGTTTVESFFDVFAGFETTDNVTLPPTRTGVSGAGGLTPDIEIMKHSVANAVPPLMVLRGQASDSGGGPGMYGVDSFFDVFFQPTAGVPDFPAESFFDVVYEITPPDGMGRFSMPPSHVVFAESFFDVFFDVDLGDGRIEHHQGHAQIESLQPLQFEVVSLNEPFPGESYLVVSISLVAFGPVDPAMPLFRITTDGETIVPVESFFDVFMTLEPGSPNTGTMTITRGSLDGGTFETMIDVQPRITFVEVGGGLELVLPDVTSYAIEQVLPHGWSYIPPAYPPEGAGPNFFASSAAPMQWVAPDGTRHSVNPALGASLPVDFDADGDVDLADFAQFAGCFNGPNRPPAAGCAADADFDGDIDVDLADFAVFSACFNGPNRPPAAGCP